MTVENMGDRWGVDLKAKPKLLIADDQPANIRVLHELFRDECEVFMATSGAQAIKTCLAQLPDLILLDVMMDDIDGHEVCRRLQAEPLTRGIPIIFITAQNDHADEAFALELGAVDFISKPIHPAIVRARVRTHLTLKQQSDTLRSIALVDGLTGVGNRRKFDADLQADWRHCLREQAPLSLILLDVDFFKRFNDRYGHQAGDDCLCAVAAGITSALRRPYDTVARYGGEEFACLLPKTSLEATLVIANKMQATVRALAIAHSDSEAAQVVTISLGVSTTVPTLETLPATLLADADTALYEAKRSGRARARTTSRGVALR